MVFTDTSAIAFYDMLKTLFANPCLIIMLGEWRTGKTDTSLLIAHLAKKWGVIERIGSNIWTFNNPSVEYITSMGALRRFLWSDKSTKLFLFDEALTHLSRRRAMSVKNVSVINLIPELSKAHARIIFITQTQNVDSTLWDSTFLRATMKKESKTVLTVKSTLFESASFSDLPRSPIRFDPDRLAEFTETESVAFGTLSLEMKVAALYADGVTYDKIAKTVGLPNKWEAIRKLRYVLRDFLAKEGITVMKPVETPQTETPAESTV